MGGMNRAGLIAGVAMLTLATACSDKNKAPAGQVAATVDGEDVTIRELNAEVQGLNAPKTAPAKQVEQVALQRVVERKMLAEVARKRGLDKSPEFLLAEKRGTEALLVQSLQASIARGVPRTTREAAQKFMEESPDLFAERKIYTLDQIRFLRPPETAGLNLQPAKTIDQVAAALTAAKIKFERSSVQYDALQVNPQLTEEISKIVARNGTEPFMFAQQPPGAPAPIMFVNHVTGSRTEPFIGENAIKFAQEVKQREAISKALQDALIKFKAEAKPNIKYGANYSPPPEKPATPAAKPAGVPAT